VGVELLEAGQGAQADGKEGDVVVADVQYLQIVQQVERERHFGQVVVLQVEML
jgi:hypothetical protein